MVTLTSMGTFNLSLATPLNATFGSHEMTLLPQSPPFASTTPSNNQRDSSLSYLYAMSFSVLISDPRVPTFVFTLEANTTTVRTSYETIPITATLATYTGMELRRRCTFVLLCLFFLVLSLSSYFFC
jgi:hypothetical protein